MVQSRYNLTYHKHNGIIVINKFGKHIHNKQEKILEFNKERHKINDKIFRFLQEFEISEGANKAKKIKLKITHGV